MRNYTLDTALVPWTAENRQQYSNWITAAMRGEDGQGEAGAGWGIKIVSFHIAQAEPVSGNIHFPAPRVPECMATIGIFPFAVARYIRERLHCVSYRGGANLAEWARAIRAVTIDGATLAPVDHQVTPPQ